MTVKNKTNESGRSMVEMLGVLAIIGVLSVTGVAGYKAAVRKALANNLLNQASMRATDVATQIGSGNLDSLGNDAFDGNLGGGVTMTPGVKGPDGYTDYDESNEQFTLTLEGLDEEMCQQMQSMAGGSRSVVRAVLCDGDKAILTFNKDLSANPVSSDFDGNKEGCESSGRKYCDNDTCIPATEECPVTGPTCPTGTSTEGAGGYATTLADNSMCYCETAGTVYKDGTCESKGDDNTCSSYADCDKGEYCQFSPTGCETDPTSGTCQSVSGCGLYDLDIGDGKKYTASNYGEPCYPNWWTAKDICASLNMHMPSLSEVGCEYYKDDICPPEGTVFGALKAKGLKYSFWTTDMYDSCSAWCVLSGMAADVDHQVRDYNYYDFLCVR